jgi:hypothetical protein
VEIATGGTPQIPLKIVLMKTETVKMTRETAYYLDNMYKMFSRGLAILFINSMGIVMK